MNNPLTVYKASAGSGKTFTLAKEYMKLVIHDPQCYRTILAVTFTNKATEEMKTRILSQLYGIWKDLPNSKIYKDKITSDLALSPETVSMNAGIALKNLLHNYNYFRVETIDTFFQSVLRNIARELDLTANLKIELNDYQVEQLAVDELIESLESNDIILSWIINYIKNNISEDKNWNVIGLIKKFGENIFKDFYKEHSAKLYKVLKDENFFKDYSDKLRKIRKEADDSLKQYAETFFDLLNENGFTVEDFSRGKSGPCGYFIKIRDGKYTDKDLLTKTVVDAMEDANKWVTKKEQTPGNNKLEFAVGSLLPLINDTERRRPALRKLYYSADLTLRHLDQLRLLGSIEKKVREMNTDANRFLLSDTQNLLNSLIQNSDSPFIFEKIGTQLEHIMIDEFQDTSCIQWKNFKVLLDECMSHENAANLIVGDVKQSIYRWRSGDWRLLNNINEEFHPGSLNIDTETLKINYRSDKNIIEFNNAFFIKAAEAEYKALEDSNSTEAQQMKNAYNDVKQTIPPKKEDKGFVHIELFPKEDYQNNTLLQLADSVNDLTSKGIPYKKIAILVRSNKTIQLIANYFMENWPNIPLVSDEAFQLDASTSVNTIISALRYISHPDNELEEAFLKKSEKLDILIAHIEDFRAKPLYDLAENLYNIFGLNELTDQSAYICAFFDQLNSFLQDNMPDIDSFLNEWDENLHQKTIQSGEIEGIRLITIHKSKGLEFDNVLMPFCDWQLEKQNTIWCTPEEKPLDELPLVPIDYSENGMMGTIYEKDYLHEHLQNVVDNLNLLYVAFTRASKNLFVFGKRGDVRTRSAIIENIIQDVAKKLDGSTLEGDISKKSEKITFTYGTLSEYVEKDEEDKENIFLRRPKEHTVDKIENYLANVEFKQSNESKDFIKADEDDEKQDNYIKTGNILHKLLSTIRTTDDIEKALKQLEVDGILYDKDLNHDKLENMLRKRLEDPRVRDWFSPRWQLFNECNICYIDSSTNKVTKQRPDRVMTDGKQIIVVDFKFGHSRPEYQKQVHDYMILLRDMGYRNIKGYLWFVYSNKIEAVK
ncbi:MAG: UvrD-helicase domain-containing protein [Prevotella sp.]|jgi:ATP-dependent exoDNAse (exonuclease V) beta subunit|nr:UvrD-helicase domain-containing protein [Prevotella sp.]MCI1281518.1 UvrD-helicase domain-containing protein [Prevotella sp.]